jgi:hypothetical protein
MSSVTGVPPAEPSDVPEMAFGPRIGHLQRKSLEFPSKGALGFREFRGCSGSRRQTFKRVNEHTAGRAGSKPCECGPSSRVGTSLLHFPLPLGMRG